MPTSAPHRTRNEDETMARMAAELRASLTAQPPSIASKYLYDDRGSQLFDDITREPEYYPTRTEEAILEASAGAIIERARPKELVELGSGVGRKVRLLLDAMRSSGESGRLVMFDINESFVAESVRQLAPDYPGLETRGVVGDFTTDLSALGPGGGRLVIFLAGTIGNLPRPEAALFLRRLAGQLAPGDFALLGVDLVKDVARLEAAYNDAAGVTAAFTLNVLRAINEQLEADFDPRGWEHVATYSRERARIEIAVRSRRDQHVRIAGCDLELDFQAGDEIRTEVSCKYTRETLEELLDGSGLHIDSWYSDPQKLFAVVLLERGPVR